MLRHPWDIPVEVTTGSEPHRWGLRGEVCAICTFANPKTDREHGCMLAHPGDLERELGEEPEEMHFQRRIWYSVHTTPST